MTTFEKLLATDVTKYMEKKGNFSYLSWSWAVQELRKADPKATWEVIKTDDAPFMATKCGVFVEVAVTVEGITLSQIHPVLDHRNKPVATPDAFQINTSIQRCLVKAIALHGLGLHIYQGEDLPPANPEEETCQFWIDKFMAIANLPQLKNTWAKHGAGLKETFEGEEFVKITMAKDRRKNEIMEDLK